MRSSNLIFIAGLIFILLTDTIFWIQLKQYMDYILSFSSVP